MMTWLAWLLVALTALPLVMTLVNLPFYLRPLAARPARRGRLVSVLIPARDEADNIDGVLASVLQERDLPLEVLVLDDDSGDATSARVRAWEQRDVRVRLLEGAPLPAQWNGKQHACRQLAEAARGDSLLFLDADVRLERGALAALDSERRARGLDLLSGVPRQRVRSLLEAAVVPLVHFVLLGYLPMFIAVWSRHPAFAAGCGQLILVDARAYRAAGGHAAIRASRHDGLRLPRAFRRAGLATGLADLSRSATCRMYATAGEVWKGFAKNADEGMATPFALPLWTGLLLAPVALLASALVGATLPLPVFGVTMLVFTAPLLQALRFGYPLFVVPLHPLGLLVLVTIQWQALVRRITGGTTDWKGRPAEVSS